MWLPLHALDPQFEQLFALLMCQTTSLVITVLLLLIRLMANNLQCLQKALCMLYGTPRAESKHHHLYTIENAMPDVLNSVYSQT